MVWQAANFLIKGPYLCLIGEAMIQMGVSVLHRKRAFLQRQMYYKKYNRNVITCTVMQAVKF